MYSYNPEICVNIEDNIIEGRSVTAYKRAKVIAGKKEELDRRWEDTVNTQKKFYNQKHKQISFRVNDLVILLTKNLKATWPNYKLLDHFLGLFKVVRVLTNSILYELKLPLLFKIFLVFHVLLLELYYL
jgi:mRNA degradation ribonuclease J1/J2